jgi:hypothetical protein
MVAARRRWDEPESMSIKQRVAVVVRGIDHRPHGWHGTTAPPVLRRHNSPSASGSGHPHSFAGVACDTSTGMAQSRVTTRSFGRFCSASRIARLPPAGQVFEGGRLEQRLLELPPLLFAQL